MMPQPRMSTAAQLLPTSSHSSAAATQGLHLGLAAPAAAATLPLLSAAQEAPNGLQAVLQLTMAPAITPALKGGGLAAAAPLLIVLQVLLLLRLSLLQFDPPRGQIPSAVLSQLILQRST